MADFYMDSPYSMRFLKAACLILETWILLNFICIIIFPDFMYVDDRGWGANWLLGYKNLHIYYFIPYFAIKAIIQYFEKSNLTISYYIMIAIILEVHDIYLAGFDGYSHDSQQNYALQSMDFAVKNAIADARNLGMIEALKAFKKEVNITWVTTPKYVVI